MYGIGKYNKLGRQFNQLLMDRFTVYDKDKPTYTDEVLEGRFTGTIKDFKLHTEGNRFKSIERPLAVVSGEISEVDTSFDRVQFADKYRPTFEMKQELTDEQIKQFVDAGMYRNERFEELMTKVSRDMTFSFDTSVQARRFDFSKAFPDSRLGEVCLLDDVGKMVFEHDDERFTSIQNVFEESTYLLSDLEAGYRAESEFSDAFNEQERGEAPAYMQEETEEMIEVERPDESYLSIDEVFDVDVENERKEEEVIEVDTPDELLIDAEEEMDAIFGQEDEDVLIEQMKRTQALENEKYDRIAADDYVDDDLLRDIEDMTLEEFLQQEESDLSTEAKNRKRQKASEKQAYEDDGLGF